MKTIKFSLVAIATILTFGFANAQDGVGIQAGYSTETTKQGDNSSTLKGFHVGPTYEMSIQGPISLQYGALYNYLTASESFYGATGTETKHSIDVPVRLAATFPLTSNGLSAFVFGGPNFNIGIADQIKATILGSTTTYDSYKDVVIGGVTVQKASSRFDFQLGAGVGLKYKNFGVKASYDWGLFNKVKDADPAITANALKVGLFYNF